AAVRGFSPAGRFLLGYDSFWSYVKPPMWCFYSTPHRRFTQNLGWSLCLNVFLIQGGIKAPFLPLSAENPDSPHHHICQRLSRSWHGRRSLSEPPGAEITQ
ncbi:MAG: hypothetical protein SOX80_04930, partial [Candidatus Fimivivens sp.]|nr:hypothetical protein [Candidatus Fimivivens sp.]